MSVNNEKVAKNILSLIQNIHTIADDTETLNIVLTDEVLIFAIKDLDYKMNNNLKSYSEQKVQLLSLSENNSQKEFSKEKIKLIERTLLSYYKLYQSYESVKNSRNISDSDIELVTDINTVKMILIQAGLLQPELIVAEKCK